MEDNDVEAMYLYTEKATDLIYEAKLFDTYVLVRPASPMFYTAIKKMPIMDFADEFEEYCGDWGHVRQLIAGSDTPVILN